MLEIRHLAVKIGTDPVIHAVRDISLSIPKGSIYGLIGESGCGKSVTGSALLGLLPDDVKVTATELSLDGASILGNEAALRGRRIALISQDPAAALNPVLTIKRQMDDVLRSHLMTGTGKKLKRDKALELLSDVGLPDPDNVMRSYPHQLSGGMQQRVVIALALATGADFLIADEPTTALDVSVEAQVLELLQRLVKERELTVLMITHDMSVIDRCCPEVSVVYAGVLVESGPTAQIFANPEHPYTRALLGALPSAGKRGQPLQTLEGVIPSATEAFKGCIFAERCPKVVDECHESTPAKRSNGTQMARCHFAVGEVQDD